MTTWQECAPDNVPQLSCIPLVFSEIINAALVFSGIIALFFIIFGGIKMVTSGGDAKALEGARKTLTFAIIGLVIILLSFLIINIVATVTQANCINTFSVTGCGT